ncbi:hypothetical protein B0T26DRAFT_755046 [Lasiosphaeria miniovina]|uniref:Uncharacterized protein n=1 Tax=Lasiosphaeria miniovina TaxID=1954250 RepID=A0AA40A5W1_9PEZI|nr:uncharacterized protein B0T26DRAFT_755046 [Lasiosphaeria miniovina]KAK0709913.1 hypothetical protein B0T26DRAFT_755046 [Lasiosphaeria miniovina]
MAAAPRSDRSLVRFGKVVLIARRAEQLAADKRAVEAAAVTEGLLQVRVKTYAVDLVDTPALLAALDDGEAAFGKPEVVFFQCCPRAAVGAARREVTGLAALARADAARPALIETRSTLPQQPIPLALTYAPGVHIGPVVVDGPFAQARESPSFEVEIA